MSEKDVAGALGLAQKAGKLSSGDLGVKEALSGGKAKLLVIAEDASPNTKKELNYLAEKASVPVISCMQRTGLGLCIGKAPRVAVAVLDKGFAELIIRKVECVIEAGGN